MFISLKLRFEIIKETNKNLQNHIHLERRMKIVHRMKKYENTKEEGKML